MTVPKNILNKFPKLSNEQLLLNLSNPLGKNKVIVDTDTANEIDDQFALAWTLLSVDKIDLLGVTAEPYSFQHHKEELLEAFNIIKEKKEITKVNMDLVNNYRDWVNGLIESNIHPNDIYFDTPEEGVEKSYLEIIKIFDKLNMPHEGKVFRGSNQYLSSFDEPLVTESSEFIVKSCLQYPDEKIYVCAIGCLTNIASALLMEPKIINNLVVVWTSGFPTYSVNNNTSSLNLVQDVLSSQLLFECGVANVYLPGYNVGAQLTLSLPDMKEFVKGRGEIGNYLFELYTNNPLHEQRGVIDQTWRTWIIWDVINIAWMINPSWVPSHVVPSPVLDDELYWRREGESFPMREAHGVNRDAIFHDFFKKIDKLK
ncbi:MAG: nucleoside hydrolase [Gammaproteobacteria bacterium]|jgi:purine nucleosidase|tara:strand:- start:8226 stop:9335 length:1110 start_codon:yes stop_codon:yes gene_type:complete